MKKYGFLRWLPGRFAPRAEDDIAMRDDLFDLLFEDGPGEAPPENTQTPEPAFEDAWAALLATGEYLRETVEKMRETEQKAREAVSNLEKRLCKPEEIIDDMFVLRLERQFDTQGFGFNRAAERARFGCRDSPCHTEIDLFLENRGCALAVSVKPRYIEAGKHGELRANAAGRMEANVGDVREHVERMGKLRRYFDLSNDGRALYGAVAAAVFPEDALGFALGQGFYAVEYAGERIAVREPEGGAKAW
jgi:hypothetical protein